MGDGPLPPIFPILRAAIFWHLFPAPDRVNSVYLFFIFSYFILIFVSIIFSFARLPCRLCHGYGWIKRTAIYFYITMVNILSINAKGLNSPQKRWLALSYFHKLKVHIVAVHHLPLLLDFHIALRQMVKLRNLELLFSLPNNGTSHWY